MNAQELLRAGHLDEAIAALGPELREQPSDVRCRLFLFELLCLAGNYDRAEKQLNILADSTDSGRTGALFLRVLLEAEKARQKLAASGEFPESAGESGPGAWNGSAFQRLEDADPRQPSHFEFITSGGYHRIALDEVLQVDMEPPKRLRDLIWAPATVVFRKREDSAADALIPVLAPGSFSHPDPQVRLGRSTVWETRDGVEIPFGQRLFIIEQDEMPVLELRSLVFERRDVAADES